MVLSIIFLEDKHKIVLHLSIFYEYQQFFQHRICFSIQPQLQLVNLHRNLRYFLIKLHTWFCLSYFLKANKKFCCIYQHRICSSIQPPDYSDPWPRLACSSSFFLIMLFKKYTTYSTISIYSKVVQWHLCNIAWWILFYFQEIFWHWKLFIEAACVLQNLDYKNENFEFTFTNWNWTMG